DNQTALLFTLSQKDGLKSFVLPVGQTKLTTLIERWHLRLTSRSLEEPQAAGELFRAALGQIELAGLLNPQRYARLVLVGDGPLLSLPWAALRDGSGRRLIERFPLSTSISLGVLTWPSNPRRPTAS